MEFKELLDDFNNFTKNQDLGERLNISKQTSSSDNRGGKVVNDAEKMSLNISKGLQNQDSGTNNINDSLANPGSADDNSNLTDEVSGSDISQDQTVDNNEESAQ